jgi:hypothetical protein
MTQEQKEQLMYLVRCFVVGDEEQEQFDYMFREDEMCTLDEIKDKFGVDDESAQIIYDRFLSYREEDYEDDWQLDEEMTDHLSNKYFNTTGSEVIKLWNEVLWSEVMSGK